MSKYDDMRRSAGRQSTIILTEGVPKVQPPKPKPLETRIINDSAAPRFKTIPLKDKIRNTLGFIDHEANPPYTDGVRSTGERLNMKWFVPFMYGLIIGIGICLIIFEIMYQ